MRMNSCPGCGSHSQDQGEEAWDQSGQLMNQSGRSFLRGALGLHD